MMKTIMILVAVTVLLIAAAASAVAGDVSVTTCPNGCVTMQGDINDILRLRGGGKLQGKRAVAQKVRRKKREVVAIKVAKTSHQMHFGQNIANLSFAYAQGKYWVKDFQGEIYPASCSRQAKWFERTDYGSGWCFKCTADGYALTIVVGSSSGYGASVTGWWEGHSF